MVLMQTFRFFHSMASLFIWTCAASVSESEFRGKENWSLFRLDFYYLETCKSHGSFLESYLLETVLNNLRLEVKQWHLQEEQNQPFP